MSEQMMSNPSYALTLRLRRDSRYMAYVLAAYQQQERLTDEELAETLGTLPELVVRLALCRRPASATPHFADQVRELADFTLTDEGQLASILRQVDGLESLSTLPAAHGAEARGEAQVTAPFSGLLAAARDREGEAEGEAQANEQPAEGDTTPGE